LKNIPDEEEKTVKLTVWKGDLKRAEANTLEECGDRIGYGKCRISMVFRSVQLQAPTEMLGWEYGTLDIKPQIKGTLKDSSIDGMRIKARTTLGRGKFQSSGAGTWETKRGKPIRLPVKKRYCSSLVLEFRSSSALIDKTPAFAILWLKNIPDEEEKTVKLTVWKGDLKRAEANTLEECGDRIGEVEVTLTFWRGLSGYHSNLASKDSNLADVMEVLDCAHDNDEAEGSNGIGTDGNTSSSSSSSDSDDDEDSPKLKSSKSDLESDGKRGTVDQFKDYKAHSKQLHRKNRGLMQWKGPRALQWMKHKMDHGEQKVEGLFKHHERDGGVETEV